MGRRPQMRPYSCLRQRRRNKMHKMWWLVLLLAQKYFILNMNQLAEYILGYKPYPINHGPYLWKKEWFPEWFLSIDEAFNKISLPQPNIRLDFLLEKNKNLSKEELSALGNGGMSEIVNGNARIHLTNFSSYRCSTYRKLNKNEFWDNHNKIKLLGNHLDNELLDWKENYPFRLI